MDRQQTDQILTMIDKAIIRENFSNMLDGQLISVAKDDGHDLTPEAFQILKDEFSKRNLDYSLIEFAEQNKIAIHQEKIQKVKDSAADDFLHAIWNMYLRKRKKQPAIEQRIAADSIFSLKHVLVSVQNQVGSI